MTFSCNQCQTRYHISDEKVRGKILQVRCRSCQNLVEVKDPELANARTPASAASMTLLGISAIPKDSAMAKPATAPAAVLPAPSPSAAVKPAPSLSPPRPSSPMPSYAQPRTATQPPPPSVARPAPPQPIAAKPAINAPVTPGFASRPAALGETQPNKPPVAPKVAPAVPRPPTPSPALRPPAVSYTNGAQIPAQIQPAPPPAEPKQWYYNRKGERQGPMRFSELSALLTEGKVRPEDYAWSPEIVNWKQIKDIDQFVSYLPAEPPPFEAAVSLPLPPKPVPPPPVSQPSAPVLPPTPTRAPSQPFLAAVQPAPRSPNVLPPTPTRAPSQPFMAAVQPAPVLPPTPTRAPSQPFLAAVQPVPNVLPPTPTRAPSQPFMAAVQAPAIPSVPQTQSQTHAAQPPAPPQVPAGKPPVVVKSPIAPQPVLPMQSPSAAAMQSSMNQPAGPTVAPSGMFASKDPFAGVPDAADFKAAPIQEMSAIIPISATRPSVGKRFLIPGLVVFAFVAVAVLAFSFGQDSSQQTLGSQTKTNTEDNVDNTPRPDINSMDIKALDGSSNNNQTNTQISEISNPKNPKNPKKNNDTNNTGDTDPLAALNGVNSPQKDPEVEAKLAAENAKAADLFSGKKTGVTPTITPDNKTKTEEQPTGGGSEKVAMQLVNETNIKPCIDRAFTNGDLRKETRLNISLKTDTNGKLSSFSVGNAPAGSSLENCLKSAYSRAPLKEAGGAVSLNFPIIASPSF